MGSLVQLDASPFAWLETRGPQLALHGAIDDATGTVLALVFRPTEDLHGYVTLLQQLVTTHGLPLALYGDRLNVFVRNDPHWTVAEQLRGTQDPTHFGRLLRELGIERGHATGAGGCDGLFIVVVGNVASGEYAGLGFAPGAPAAAVAVVAT